MNKQINIYVDGAALIGVNFGLISLVVEVPEESRVLTRMVKKVQKDDNIDIQESQKNLTNNYCEFAAVDNCLVYITNYMGFLRKYSPTKFVIFSDSQLVVQQINGQWESRSETSTFWIPKIKERISALRKQYPNIQIEFRWIPRELNKAGKLLETYCWQNKLKLYGSLINKQNQNNGSMD